MIDFKDYIGISFKKIISLHCILKAKIKNKKGFFIIDTGASNSCIAKEKKDFFELHTEDDKNIKIMGAGPEKINALLSKKETIYLKEYNTRISFLIIDMSAINESINKEGGIKIDGILGGDFLKKTKAIIDFGKNIIYLKR